MRLLETRAHDLALALDPRDQLAAWRDPAEGLIDPRRLVGVEVIARRVAGTWSAMRPPLQLRVVANPSGYRMWFGAIEGEDGSTTRLGFPPSDQYRVAVGGGAFGRIHLDRTLEPTSTPVVCSLPPGYEYPFVGVEPIRLGEPEVEGRGPTLLRGTLRATDGRPWEDVHVTARVGGAPLPAERSTATITGETGHWVIALHPEQPLAGLAVRFTTAGSDGAAPTTYDVPEVRPVRGRARLVSQTALFGRVQTAHGAPIGGAAVTIDSDASLLVKTDRAGRWSLVFAPDQHLGPGDIDATVTATLSGGTSASRAITFAARTNTRVEDFTF